MKLVMISGMPAAGKTAIGERISRELGMSFISKDAIKEKLYDTSTRTTHDYFWYERQAKKLFWHEIREAIANEKSVVIESNFIGADRKPLRSLGGDVNAVELYCHARGFTIFRRYMRRNEGKKRHPGHHDRRWYPFLFVFAVLNMMGLRWPYGPTGVTAHRLYIDTTDFSKIDYTRILNQLIK